MQTGTNTNTTNPAYDGDEFDDLVAKAQQHFLDAAAAHGGQVFRTTADGGRLYQVYLDAFNDATQRQIHSCHCCRRFFEMFGDLAFVDADGNLVPAVWPEADGLYAGPMAAVRKVLNLGKVTGVFLTDRVHWMSDCGSAPQWSHFQISASTLKPYSSRTVSPGQAMAAKREDYSTLMRALDNFKVDAVNLAVQILSGEALYRSEKVLGQAEFLQRLHAIRMFEGRSGNHKTNLLWVEIAKAPDGFCHPTSSMIGTLLEDLAAGKNFADVKRAFDHKMHPARHQRPTAAPSAGTVKQAEEIVAKMGIAPSLQRRQARTDEVQTFWTPPKARTIEPEGGSVFGHLKTKDSGPDLTKVNLPRQKMTWEKFNRVVLPTAQRIQFYISGEMAPFVGITAPVDSEAPPIIQWDFEDQRNPYAWYLYVRGSAPSQWSLNRGLVDVWGIGSQPSQWNDKDGMFTHQGESVIFYLKGARDQSQASLCLFPEILKSELHQVRSVIEAHSNSRQLEVVDNPACGIRIQKGQEFGFTIVVTTAAGTAEYLIDRFD